MSNPNFKGLSMRADEEDYEAYADRMQKTANESEDLNGVVDWDRFDELWERRNESTDDMAELLAEVMGIAHDQALAWVEGRDTP